jgi:hypothetical protein
MKPIIDPDIKVNCWFCGNTRAFRMMRRPIAGSMYECVPKGPTTDGIDKLRDKMRLSGDIAVTPREALGHVRRRVVALRRPNLAAFSGEEIAISETVMQEHWGSGGRFPLSGKCLNAVLPRSTRSDRLDSQAGRTPGRCS